MLDICVINFNIINYQDYRIMNDKTKPTTSTDNSPPKIITGPDISLSQNSADKVKTETKIISGNRK